MSWILIYLIGFQLFQFHCKAKWTETLTNAQLFLDRSDQLLRRLTIRREEDIRKRPSTGKEEKEENKKTSQISNAASLRRMELASIHRVSPFLSPLRLLLDDGTKNSGIVVVVEDGALTSSLKDTNVSWCVDCFPSDYSLRFIYYHLVYHLLCCFKHLDHHSSSPRSSPKGSSPLADLWPSFRWFPPPALSPPSLSIHALRSQLTCLRRHLTSHVLVHQNYTTTTTTTTTTHIPLFFSPTILLLLLQLNRVLMALLTQLVLLVDLSTSPLSPRPIQIKKTRQGPNRHSSHQTPTTPYSSFHNTLPRRGEEGPPCNQAQPPAAIQLLSMAELHAALQRRRDQLDPNSTHNNDDDTRGDTNRETLYYEYSFHDEDDDDDDDRRRDL